MIQVRTLVSEEYELAGRMAGDAFREFADESDEWQQHLVRVADVAARADRAIVLGAFIDGQLVGTVSLELKERVNQDARPLGPQEAHVRMLGVDPKFQGQGAGRALMERCIELAKAAGKTEITLGTNPRMLAAQKLYRSLGFVEVDEPDLKYPKYLLDLDPGDKPLRLVSE